MLSQAARRAITAQDLRPIHTARDGHEGDGEILTIREVAGYLKLPVSTVYRLAERRALPGHKVGRQWRFDKAVLDDWFRQHAATSRSTILVVDDEPAIRELMVGALATQTRKVLTAGSGKEAMEILTGSGSAVDLVILDLVMPGMNGVDTFREIHSVRPALPVMIVTGYPDSELMAQALEIGSFTMISKPVDLAQFQKMVARIVGRPLILSARQPAGAERVPSVERAPRGTPGWTAVRSDDASRRTGRGTSRA
jgi:excisionase family DNA binding protein